MAVRKEIDGSASVPEFYGAELRYQREAAGLTLQMAVEGSFYGVSYLSEIERGERRMPAALARHMDQVLKTDGFFERRCEDVRKARKRGHAPYFERILEAEKHADTIEQWAPTVFPGLLQTEAYVRALFRAECPFEQHEKTEEKVQARLSRASLFKDDRTTPAYWVILHESLLRLPILPPEQMAEQLERVLVLGRRGRLLAQVLPWNAGAHPLMLGNAMTLTFADAPPLFYTESQHHGTTVDDPGLVKRYQRSYDLLRAAALPPEASLAMIEATAEDYRNGKQTR
ncbi:helix-turn-helix domain-containing protein [Streptomyces sp. PR69]|uniref:helix-turn-helix domain-containing protein n=1 Tax=Streptomyces sp. PR69 TaxID=2984950 RepID=UPI0022643FA1|nr:helix-turn-helix transcriptional regulator [Streptomyces sp. PR69]